MRLAVSFRSSILLALLVLFACPPLLAQETDFEEPPFAKIHAAYRERDEPTYTRLLRGALREARRLLPAACIQRQRDLAAVAKVLGFDGLESLWLIYQDCAAQERGTAMIQAREENVRALRPILRYAGEPAPQLPIRVSHWNSVFERGVRGEAVRKVLAGYAQAEPAKAQGWSLRSALAKAQVKTGLCGLPPRFNQYGQIATAELLRQGQCLTGAIGPAEICEKLGFGKEEGTATMGSGGSLPGMSQADTERLGDLCNDLGSGAGAVGGGFDLLDGFSTDQCAGEDETYLYETEEIAQLVQDCYSGGEGNPFALGPADVGIVTNTVIEWENAGTANAFITIGSGPDRDHYHGTADTSAEARERLEAQLDAAAQAAPKDQEGNAILKSDEWVEENADGTTTQVQETVTRTPDGAIITETNRTNSDGSSSSERTQQNRDGSSESRTVGVDAEGNSTTTETKTDKDGNTTFKTVNRDKDGNVTSEGEGTIGAPDKQSGDENHFDPHNPACQELATLGILPGSNRGQFWDQLFERGRHVDPRKVYPSPDTAGTEEEPLCGAPGLGNTNAPAKCSTPVLCFEGTALDDSCGCSRPAGGRIALQGCFAANCPPDTVPQAVGMNACICASGEPPAEGPPPLPDVARAELFFSELVWNRSDGMIFVTEEMAGEGGLTSEPPR